MHSDNDTDAVMNGHLENDRKRAHEEASSAQAIEHTSPLRVDEVAGNVHYRAKKRVKLLSNTATQPASAPRTSTSRRSHIATVQAVGAAATRSPRGENDDPPTANAQLARGPSRRSSRSSRNMINRFGDYEQPVNGLEIEEGQTTDQQQESSLDDDNDRGGGVDKRITASPGARKQSAPLPFEERFKALLKLKEKFDHCNGPRLQPSVSEYNSLASWCTKLRHVYKTGQKGEARHLQLSVENICRFGGSWFQLEPDCFS